MKEISTIMRELLAIIGDLAGIAGIILAIRKEH